MSRFAFILLLQVTYGFHRFQFWTRIVGEVQPQRPCMLRPAGGLENSFNNDGGGNADTIGWNYRHGNYVLIPSRGRKPIAVIHFLGGGFVGAAPQLTYRYFLDTIAQRGYLIVATPYRTQFDHVESCNEIVGRFDAVARDLVLEYGPLPVIGMGHSLGALLQTLITSLFPDTARAVNVLMSFNNKLAAEAIPAFNELVVPFAELAASRAPEVGSFTTVRAFSEQLLKDVYVPDTDEGSILSALLQSLDLFDQLPAVLQSVAQGTREFSPSPSDTLEACRRMYRARHTLVLKFARDSIDESEGIARVLAEANGIMRMRRPLAEMEVVLRELRGTHLTPLVPGPGALGLRDFDVSTGVWEEQDLTRDLSATADTVCAEICSYLDRVVGNSQQNP